MLAAVNRICQRTQFRLLPCLPGRANAGRNFTSTYSARDVKASFLPSPESTSLPRPRLDFRSISEDVLYKSHNAFNRRAPLPVGTAQSVARLYIEFKRLSSELNGKLHARQAIGNRVRTAAGDEKGKAIEEAKALKDEIGTLKERLSELEDEMFPLALSLPNDTHPDVPVGPEDAAVTLSTHGPAPLPASQDRDHLHVASALGWVDLKSAAIVTGSSWYYLLDEGALLENAIIQYAMSRSLARGFRPVMTPDMVRSDVATRCGFQPRDQGNVHQMYHIQPSTGARPELVLSGTAEIPLAGLYANQTLAEDQLPMKLVGLGHAFRSEAGARGADTRGLYRVHQFTKLELFAIASEGQSEDMMKKMLDIQLEIYNGLGLPLRVLDMPTQELGASAYRKFDVEAWMPGKGTWGEISSTSNCTDYQCRRLHIRYRRTPTSLSSTGSTPSRVPAESTPLPFAHTLNGTAAAIPRLIVALLENGANLDNYGRVASVRLPKALQPFWLGGTNSSSRIEWV